LTTTSVAFDGTTLDIIGTGPLIGPGVPIHNDGILDLAFTQAGGAGEAISGSGSFTASVPEPSTWAMMLLGLAGLCFVGARKRPRLAL
jgi:hypothetical protein